MIWRDASGESKRRWREKGGGGGGKDTVKQAEQPVRLLQEEQQKRVIELVLVVVISAPPDCPRIPHHQWKPNVLVRLREYLVRPLRVHGMHRSEVTTPQVRFMGW